MRFRTNWLVWTLTVLAGSTCLFLSEGLAADAGVMVVESTTPAAPPEFTPEVVRTGAKTMVSAYEGGRWGLLIGWASLLIVGALKKAKIWKHAPEGMAKWVAGGLNMLGALGVGLVQGWPMTTILIDAGVGIFTAVGTDQYVFAPRREKKRKSLPPEGTVVESPSQS